LRTDTLANDLAGIARLLWCNWGNEFIEHPLGVGEVPDRDKELCQTLLKATLEVIVHLSSIVKRSLPKFTAKYLMRQATNA
jgi:hypothetical protein